MTAVDEQEYEIPAEELIPQDAPVESPFSLNWRMVDGYGCEVQVTMRAGVNQAVITEVMTGRKLFVDLAQKHGWALGNKPAGTAPAPFNGKAEVAQLQAGNAAWVPPAPTGPVAQQVAGGGFASQGTQTFLAVKMTVMPRADGKVEVGWFEAGHQWADVKTVKTPQDLVNVLAPTGEYWPLELFTKAGEYGVTHIVEWVPSVNLNKSGKPYKNLVSVRRAAQP